MIRPGIHATIDLETLGVSLFLIPILILSYVTFF